MIQKTTLVVMAAGMGSREQTLRHGARDLLLGITYREDLQEVKDAIGGYIRDGLYKNL